MTFDLSTKAGRLRSALYDKLLEHKRDGAIPTNGRFLFYELEQAGAIPKAYYDGDGRKKARQPAQDVCDALTWLRQRGVVPWEWIVDETREVVDWQYAATAYDYIAEAAKRARIDCWGGETPPLIVCEARATKGVLERIAGEYLSSITATNGQCGGFLMTDLVPRLVENDRRVLYIGDHEVGGPADSIEANTRRVLEEGAGRSIAWKRIALTTEQVDADSRLLGLAIEKIDKRFKPPRPYQAVECEAAGQLELERLLRQTLDALLPEPLDRVLVREGAERDAAIELLRSARPWRRPR